MASVWFSVMVLVVVHNVLGDSICSDSRHQFNCDECIRCGGYWCVKPKDGASRCSMTLPDNWCPDKPLSMAQVSTKIEPGNANGINPISVVKSFKRIPTAEAFELNYPAKNTKNVGIQIVNTTQDHMHHHSMGVEIKVVTNECKDGTCTALLSANPNKEFCSANSTMYEFVNAEIKIDGFKESAHVKYHVPCACECSQNVEVDSLHCHGHGNYTCGECSCRDGWTGDDCSKSNKMCEKTRFDTPCRGLLSDLDCSGNGFCDGNNECTCDMTKEGSKYFATECFCVDLCLVINNDEDYEEAFLNSTIGEYRFSESKQMFLEPYKQAQLDERDDIDRKVWVNCNSTFNDCFFTYVAKIDDYDGQVHVMVVESCKMAIAGETFAANGVPLILGIIGIVAAVMAMASVVIWKYMNAVPPVPLNDSGYTTIDAENCVGENPLYKPPTSSFKNPTYGKW